MRLEASPALLLLTVYSLLACAPPQSGITPQPQAEPTNTETPALGVLLPVATPSPTETTSPEASLTPTPLPEATPVAQVEPTVTLVGGLEPVQAPSATRPVKLTLRLVGGYGGTPFELRYDPSIWQPVFGAEMQWVRFRHTSIPGCELDPQAGGRGVDGTMVVEKRVIAGYEFEVRTFFGDDLVAFAASLPEGYYLFSVDYIQRVPPETLIRCREEVAALLESFRLVKE